MWGIVTYIFEFAKLQCSKQLLPGLSRLGLNFAGCGDWKVGIWGQLLVWTTTADGTLQRDWVCDEYRVPFFGRCDIV